MTTRDIKPEHKEEGVDRKDRKSTHTKRYIHEEVQHKQGTAQKMYNAKKVHCSSKSVTDTDAHGSVYVGGVEGLTSVVDV